MENKENIDKFDNTINSDSYVIIDNLYIPNYLESVFNEKILYINSLSSSQIDIEKNIFNFQKTFLKNLKDIYFSDNFDYITISSLENQIYQIIPLSP